MKLFATIVLLIITVVSCSNVSTPPAVPSVTPDRPPNWWISWLAQPVCKPPCWQNITPGITTFAEAVSILEQTPGTTITYKSKDGLDWEFSKEEGGMLVASPDGTVEGFSIGSISDNKL